MRAAAARWPLRAGLALCAVQAAGAAPLQITVLGSDRQPLADAVLLLEPLGAKAAVKPAQGVEIGQQDKQFQPQISVVPLGTRVAFPNRDTVRHHVYSFSQPKKFEIKLYVGRPENPVEFDMPGVVILGCNIHDHMVGWVIVTDTPWHGKTTASGRLNLADLPAGKYRLRAWHPGLPTGHTGSEQTLSQGSTAQELQLQLPAVALTASR